MEHGKIISRAWNIIWANKWMFILGFLAALGSGSGSSGTNFNFPSGNGSAGGGDFGFPTDFEQTMSDIAPFLIAGICFIFLIGIALWLLRLIGEAGMIASVDRIEAGEKLGFGDGFRAGTGHLKNMVGLSLVLYGPIILFGLIVAGGVLFSTVGAVSGNGDGAGAAIGLLAACMIPIGCLIAIFSLVITFVYPMAQRSIIIKGLSIMDSVRDGWQVVRSNFGDIFVLGLIFFMISLAVGFASLIISLPILAITILPIILAVAEGGAVFTAASVIFAVIGIIVFILITAAVSSILRTLQSTSFTLAYHQWMGGKKAAAVAS